MLAGRDGELRRSRELLKAKRGEGATALVLNPVATRKKLGPEPRPEKPRQRRKRAEKTRRPAKRKIRRRPGPLAGALPARNQHHLPRWGSLILRPPGWRLQD